MNIEQIGTNRIVVGAHYGLGDWIAQRVTAVVMAAFTILLTATFLIGKVSSYEAWAGMFAIPWFRIASFLAFMAMFYHVWVGMRDIWMDYVKPASLRLTFHIVTVLWLIGCACWSCQILWKL